MHEVGELADLVRRRKNGNAAYYNLNLHINPTNVCIFRCACAPTVATRIDPRAYTMERGRDSRMRARKRPTRAAPNCTSSAACIRTKTFDWYVGIIRDLHAAFPRLHLKAWTAVEIDHFAADDQAAGASDSRRTDRGRARQYARRRGRDLRRRRSAREICPRKADAKTWLDIHRTAHELGLRTNASMLYGHIESIEHRVEHLVRLRQLQDATGGFQAFVPLAFHPQNTALSHLRRVSALEDLRVTAVSRLMLDNFDHIKAYWISLGVGTAQTALAYGADDLDGTVRRERIHHDAGATSPEELSVEELQSLIVEAGREPVERDSLYRRVRRGESGQWCGSGQSAVCSGRSLAPASTPGFRSIFHAICRNHRRRVGHAALAHEPSGAAKTVDSADRRAEPVGDRHRAARRTAAAGAVLRLRRTSARRGDRAGRCRGLAPGNFSASRAGATRSTPSDSARRFLPGATPRR